MKTKRRDLYIHIGTGDMVQATKGAAKKLSEDYKKVEFTTNDKGKPVARVRLGNGVTMDVSERETTEVPQHVNTKAD